jgi:hypothetical protein
MMKLAVLLLLAVGPSSCDWPGTPCPAMATAALTVTVANAANGQPICDATVTATDGTYSETLRVFGCTYTGAFERPGTYVVRAVREGFAPAEHGPVSVARNDDACRTLEGARVTLALTPQPQGLRSLREEFQFLRPPLPQNCIF